MGQTIEIRDSAQVGEVLLVNTDRSLTGQDGYAYSPSDPVDTDSIFPARLAARLFESDPAIDHVYVMSNTLSIRRRGGWDAEATANANEVISSFFRFYDEP